MTQDFFDGYPRDDDTINGIFTIPDTKAVNISLQPLTIVDGVDGEKKLDIVSVDEYLTVDSLGDIIKRNNEQQWPKI